MRICTLNFCVYKPLILGYNIIRNILIEVKMDFKKDMNNLHDKSYKDLYSNKEVFLDLDLLSFSLA